MIGHNSSCHRQEKIKGQWWMQLCYSFVFLQSLQTDVLHFLYTFSNDGIFHILLEKDTAISIVFQTIGIIHKTWQKTAEDP